MRVLMEPFPQEGIVHNRSLESSMQNRVIRLETGGSIFLLGKEKGEYWRDVKGALDQAPS